MSASLVAGAWESVVGGGVAVCCGTVVAVLVAGGARCGGWLVLVAEVLVAEVSVAVVLVGTVPDVAVLPAVLVASALVGVVVAGGVGAPGVGGSVEVPSPVTKAPFFAVNMTNPPESGVCRLASAPATLPSGPATR